MDAVDRDAVTAELQRQGAGQVHQGGVAGAAAEIAGRAGVGAADVDDAPPSRRLHVRQGGAAATQSADVLDVEILQQVRVDNRVDTPDRRRRATGRGAAVDQDVQAAELFGRLMRHAIHLLAAGHVGHHRNDALAGFGCQFLGCRRQFRVAACHDRHVHALAGQFQRNRLANAAAAAGDNSLPAS